MSGIAYLSEKNISGRALGFLKKPILIIFIISIAIRLILAPLLTMNYDVYHWALVMQNIQAGNGLYEVAGYYYTPIWGYLIGFTSMLHDVFLNMPVFGERFLVALPVEGGGYVQATATITTVGFNFFIKLILFVADVIVGYMIYQIVKEHTQDEKKATMGAALWLLCPSVIAISAVCGMFDAFCVLFLVAAMILAHRSMYFLAGVMLSFSILTKFFPVFFAAFFIAYILMKHRDDVRKWKYLAKAMLGAVIAAVLVLMPQILTGTLSDAFSFITGRASGGLGAGLGPIVTYGTMVAYVAIFALTAFISWKYYKKGDRSFNAMLKYMLLTATVTLLYPPTPQYTLIVVPFLIMSIVLLDRQLIKPWILMSIFVTASALTSSFALLLSAGAYMNLISLDTVVVLLEHHNVLGFNVDTAIYAFVVVMQYISILSILYFACLRKGSILSDDLRSQSGQTVKE